MNYANRTHTHTHTRRADMLKNKNEIIMFAYLKNVRLLRSLKVEVGAQTLKLLYFSAYNGFTKILLQTCVVS